MTDYISREAAIAEIMGQPPDAHYPSWYAEQLKKIPAADVRPVVHGHWEDRGSLSARCSECGCKSLRASHYCPACGADMRKEANK